MSSIVKLSTKLSLAAITFALSMSGVLANTLSEVQINALDTGYGIVLKTDETAQMKKIVSSNDKMTIELKNVNVSSDLNTVYNNVANIDNVTVSPLSKSDIKIVLKGKDIANSKVDFETIKTTLPVSASSKQSIELSAPVTSYTPVYNPNAFKEDTDSQTSNIKVNEVLTQMHVSKAMLVSVKRLAKKVINKAKSGDINLMTVLGAIMLIGAFMLKPRRKESVAKQSAQPSLSSVMQRTPQMEREISLNNRLADNMNLNRNASLNSNPLKAGYGLKAYQQSQKNPYMTQNTRNAGVSGIARRKPLHTAAPIKKSTMRNKPVAMQKVNNPIKSQAPAMKAKSSMAATAQQPDMDSMKFLESITKIYEKNGRTDLAKGLKDNLRKAQMAGSI